MGRKFYGLFAIVLVMAVTVSACFGAAEGEKSSVLAPGAKVEKLAGDFKFTEGPAADGEGNVFFSDIPNNRILRWSIHGELTTYREDSGGSNGLFVDKKGNLLACEGGRRRVVSIDGFGKVTVLADSYEGPSGAGKKFNSPNDLWVDANGGVYFTDPSYDKKSELEQGGEHVYYIAPERPPQPVVSESNQPAEPNDANAPPKKKEGWEVIRVISDMVKPNGIIGTPDGKTLYVTDHGSDKTFKYSINPDGTLSNKELFAPESSDGMTIDNEGNVYLTVMAAKTLQSYDTGANPVAVYNSKGVKIESIEIPERPANVCFGGKDKQTLFITAQTSLYAVKMRVKGV
jgi:gluconolactonase